MVYSVWHYNKVSFVNDYIITTSSIWKVEVSQSSAVQTEQFHKVIITVAFDRLLYVLCSGVNIYGPGNKV